MLPDTASLRPIGSAWTVRITHPLSQSMQSMSSARRFSKQACALALRTASISGLQINCRIVVLIPSDLPDFDAFLLLGGLPFVLPLLIGLQ
jgi:hypothetical protein